MNIQIEAKKLSDEQRLEFSDEFYNFAPDWLDDFDTPHPWGCPWFSITTVFLKGNSVSEMAKNYYDEVIDEIERLRQEEIQEEEWF